MQNVNQWLIDNSHESQETTTKELTFAEVTRSFKHLIPVTAKCNASSKSNKCGHLLQEVKRPTMQPYILYGMTFENIPTPE